jgi:pilus assembly protein FimV
LSLDDMTVDNEEADNLDAQLESAGMDLDAEIELAEAYIEIGDVDGARELLDDVVKRSSGNLQARAQELIEKINTQ